MKSQNTLKGNFIYQPHTTFSIFPNIQPNCLEPTETFLSFCDAYILPVKAIAPRNTVSSFIFMHYIGRSWCLLLQEYGKGNKIYTKNHCPTINPVYRKIWKYKMVCWCSIYSAQLYEESHWCIHHHGNRRGICPTQKKFNTMSSTQAKIVEVEDVLKQLVCTHCFLKDKGYKIHDNIIHQNNQSAVKLDKNVRRLSSKQTQHINIRYYFISDSIKKQEASM